jgi:hypothetical protein
MRRALTLALSSSLSMALCSFAAEPAPALTAIRAGRLLDVAAEKVRENVVVVVEAGRSARSARACRPGPRSSTSRARRCCRE